MNGKVLDEDFDERIEEEVQRCKEEKAADNHEEPRVVDVCKKSYLLKGIFIYGLIFLSTNYAYYGSIFGVEALSANIYFTSIQ